MNNPSAEELRQKMARVRSKQPKRVAEMHAQAERLTDWREYVRSSPQASAAISAAAGFFVVRAITSKQDQSIAKSSEPSRPRSSVSGMALAFMTPFVSAALKNVTARLVNNLIVGITSDDPSQSNRS